MKKLLSLLLLLMASTVMWAQQLVKGIVVDGSGEPLIGVSVLEVGNATNGDVTDINGAFSIKVKSGSATLQFSYVGFTSQKVKVDNRQQIKVVMIDESHTTDEVVVVAFGKMKREAFTGSAGV